MTRCFLRSAVHQALLALIVVVCLGSGSSQAAPTGAGAPYSNPVIGDPRHVAGEIADPHILKFNGEYYLYCSGDPIRAFHSTDLVHWRAVGPVLSSAGGADAWNQADVWAPEVCYENGRFYLYYTASRKSGDWRVGEAMRRVGVAVSDSPRGPFVDSGRPLTPYWGIDGTVFRDPDGGKRTLFLSYLDEPSWPGAGIVADLMPTPLQVAGKPWRVTRGSRDWEDKDANPHNGTLRYTNEGPTVLKRHGIYYAMYSGGSWDLPTYALAYATSRQLTPSDAPGTIPMAGEGWQKYPPILRSTPLVDAPGHNGMTKAPNNFDDICVYHARVVPFLDPWNRLPFVDRLYWNQDRMFMQPPSLGDLPLPDRPVFEDRFDGADGLLSAGWTHRAGDWRVVDGLARQSSMRPAAWAGPDLKAVSYRFEANVRLLLPERAGPLGGAGITLARLDDRNHVEALLSPSRHALVVTGHRDGKPFEKVRSLPEDFRYDAWHQLLATRDGNWLLVDLDGVHALEVETGSVAPARVEIMTRATSAEFDGVAFTPAFEDFFDRAGLPGWQVRGAWKVSRGSLQGEAPAGKSAQALRPSLAAGPGGRWEVTTSMRYAPVEATAREGQPDRRAPVHWGGVVVAAGSREIRCGFEQNIWPFAKFWVEERSNGKSSRSFGVPMPRGFRYDESHAIRVASDGGRFTLYLDGQPVVAARFPGLEAGLPGLFVEGASARFDDCAGRTGVVPPNLVLNGGFETEQWDGERATPDNPWTLSGKARPNDSPAAHSGLRRLVAIGGSGQARQVVASLAPGTYTLHAWATTSGSGRVETSVPGARAATGAGPWQRLAVSFTVAAGAPRDIPITLRLVSPDGSRDVAAVDDVYLFRH